MKKIIGCFEAKTNFNKIINNVIPIVISSTINYND